MSFQLLGNIGEAASDEPNERSPVVSLETSIA